MARYHCDKVSEQLQAVKGIRVTEVTRSSWSFQLDGARASVRILPGCCGILLFYNISGKERTALKLLKETCKAAVKAKFGVVVLSLRANSPLRTLLGAEWISGRFTNPRTKNEVDLLHYVLPVKPDKTKPRPVLEDN